MTRPSLGPQVKPNCAPEPNHPTESDAFKARKLVVRAEKVLQTLLRTGWVSAFVCGLCTFVMDSRLTMFPLAWTTDHLDLGILGGVAKIMLAGPEG